MDNTHQGKVKSVLSGDTVVLTSIQNPTAPERTLSLAFVTAPRLRREGDEPYAFESREFLRKNLVGKVIRFKVLYRLPTGTQREYGIIVQQDGQALPELAVAEGWLKLREDAGRREEAEEAQQLIDRLKVLESRAKADENGMWKIEGSHVRTSYEPPNAEQYAKQLRGEPKDAIVEKVLTGDRLIVRLFESPTKHVQTMLLVAGIKAPNTKRVNTTDGSVQPAEPFGEEALEFVDSRLLQRRVSVTILGASPQNQLVGSVRHPNGDIAIFLLRAGLARCVDFHTTLLGSDMSLLRQAELDAKKNGQGLFRGATVKKGGAVETDVVVSRVQTADTLFVRLPNGQEKRINLSSVRQPKPSDPKQSPFGADAKEWMRRRLIGKHVKVAIDGKRPATEGYDEREMATVSHNGVNVGLELVQAGYASVLRHRMDDTDRSPIYDDLLLAEEAAQKEGKGMWSSKSPETKAYVDYSESLEKAKRLTSILSRQKRVPAIVDFVKGASRFTLLIPKENAKITFVLSGINAPKSARNPTDASEPFGREAHDLANKRLQQRDVEIDVEDNDKVGGFIGKLYVNRENFARVLLDEGFASVRGYSAEKSGNAQELFAAEKKAKESRRGLWHDYDPSQEVDDSTADGNGATPSNGATNGDAHANVTSKDYRDVVITHVEENCRLRVQQISGQTTGALTSLMTAFRKFQLGPESAVLSAAPKVGEYVAAKFSEDGQWYRARVRRNDRENKTSEIIYVDYGNGETVPWASLKALDNQGGSRFGVSALKTQALEASFSFIQFPSGNDDYMEEARNWLFDNLTGDRQFVARVDFTDPRDGTLWITLFDPDNTNSSESVNAELVEKGLGMVTRKPARWEKAQSRILDELKSKEDSAKSERFGVWQYGDLTGEE